MTIYVKESARPDGAKPARIFIPLPNFLLGPAVLPLLAPAVNGILRVSGGGVQLSADRLRQLARALRSWRRTAPDTTLVEVQSANGDEVRIRL